MKAEDDVLSTETIETLVIGGGQAGIAMSEHLNRNGVPHVVVERRRIAERWRSERWDTLVANGPAWHDRFPGMTFADVDPDAFAPRQSIVDYLVAYAEKFAAEIRCGVEVERLRQSDAHSAFHVETSAGVIEARNVVVATGPFQRPAIPPLVPDTAGIVQIHSSAYRNPGQLPPGGVLVVGAGSSGVQIADELARAGREVHLAVGPHNRPPRRYRGRDFVWWLGVLGKWDATVHEPGREHVTIAVSGARGGHTVDFRDLAAAGIVLVGRAEGFRDGVMQFAPDLARNIALGDADYLSVLDEADAYAAREGLDLPPDPAARDFRAGLPGEYRTPLRLDLTAAGVTSIVWATGYAFDFGWVEAGSFDARGRPIHTRGVSTVPGLYYLGLPWLSRRASAFIWGVWHDAAYLADRIAARRETNASDDGEARAAPLAL
jgi:putative flavoprotein involved in K+ transport